MMIGNQITKVLIVLTVLLFSSIAFKKYAVTKDSMEEYIEKYNAYKEKVDSTNHMVDSLKTVIAIEANEAHAAQSRANVFADQSKKVKVELNNLKSRTDSTRKTITDSTEMARVIIPKLDSVIVKQDTVIEQHKNEIFNLRLALDRKDTVITLLTMSRDSLQKVSKILPPAPKNPDKLFGVTLPSRTTSFIAGTVVGVVLLTAIKH